MAWTVKNLAAMQETQVQSTWVGKISWRRKWQFTLIFLPGKFHEQRSLVRYSPGSCKESHTIESLVHHYLTNVQLRKRKHISVSFWAIWGRAHLEPYNFVGHQKDWFCDYLCVHVWLTFHISVVSFTLQRNLILTCLILFPSIIFPF